MCSSEQASHHSVMSLNNGASLVITLLNEENTILPLLESIRSQVILPTETIIVDGGSTDSTVALIEEFAAQHPELGLRLLVRAGTIGDGRNYGVKEARTQNILSTDGGCVLGKGFVKSALRHLTSCDVVGGVYAPRPGNSFERTFLELYLPDWDKVNELPIFSNRCLACNKAAWQKVGGYNGKTRRCDDTLICLAWRRHGLKMHFAKDLIVYYTLGTGLWQQCKVSFEEVRLDHQLGIARRLPYYRKLHLVAPLALVGLVGLAVYPLISVLVLGVMLGYIWLRAFRVLLRTGSVTCFLWSFPSQFVIEASRLGGFLRFVVGAAAEALAPSFGRGGDQHDR
jgi:GT2 family glycosyltransferase